MKQIARDPGTGASKGYGFVSYTDFEASDAACESMNGQFLMNKAITVQYAFKKDGKGERHGTEAERMLATQARKNNALPAGARPPPAPMAYGTQPQNPGAYQGQFAGALAQPPPPAGFTPQQTMMAPPGPPMGMPAQMMGMAPPGPPPPNMPPNMPPPNMQMYGAYPPPPPPGFGYPPGQMPPPQYQPQ